MQLNANFFELSKHRTARLNIFVTPLEEVNISSKPLISPTQFMLSSRRTLYCNHDCLCKWIAWCRNRSPWTRRTSASQQVSPIAWRGGRLDRIVTSSLAAEAYALQGGVDMAELCNNIWLEASNATWSLTWARHNLGQWESGMQRSPTGTLVTRADCSSPLLQSVCVTDAKSLYDSLKREAKSREPRVVVAVAELKQGLSVLNLGVRWIPHQEMVCDGFTKCFSQGHLSPLLTLLRTRFAKLVAEDTLLKSRQMERTHRGYNQCSKEHYEKRRG
eukprot:4092365-Amphidinium_carterae.1